MQHGVKIPLQSMLHGKHILKQLKTGNSHQTISSIHQKKQFSDGARGRSSMLLGMNIATQGPFTPSPLNDDQAKIQRLIRAFQDYGHLKAKTNPLDLPGKRPMSVPELQPNFYGFTEVDLDRRFALGPEVLPHFATNEGQFMTLREIIK
jgi:2-oxoglutarate dehydrogenase complex dehydrogenase (E1) component-like enzyme